MSEASDTALAVPPKADPETLVLRGSPRRVIRFRRGAIIAIAALGSAGLVGLAGLSRRQIDRLRKRRLPGFPREYELGSGLSKYRNCPRFKRFEVDAGVSAAFLAITESGRLPAQIKS